VHDTKLPQRLLILAAPRMSPGRANARYPAVLEPERLQQTTDEVRTSQHLSDRERWHGQMRCDDCFRTPACLAAYTHAVRSKLDEYAVWKMGQALLVAVGHDDKSGARRVCRGFAFPFGLPPSASRQRGATGEKSGNLFGLENMQER